ncbi:hypothetical protein BDN72DRAFT_832223 [Pluteus cervinus]|uniref:Uncharacterized protein n=1 Tax=Pluteus cervinus TaxID=181527 RepID=A0ACD3BCH1_9AGAR|nr:hypothetical protein BDN72DRAFT_832223 [Pluteus cervinus]
MDAAANKRAALEQLKFNKSQFASRAAHAASSSTLSAHPNTMPYGQPPSQSRDGTVQSRFFPMTPSTSLGRVLVPNSSPLQSDDFQRFQPPQPPGNDYDVAPPASALFDDPWSISSRASRMDALTSSSNFLSHGNQIHASARRPWSSDDKEQGEEEGPPRKRLNTGATQDAPNHMTSPGSPEIQMPGNKRRAAPSVLELHSTSSDESLPEVDSAFNGLSKPRIVRERPTPSGSPSVVPDPSQDPRFIRFRMTFPMDSPARIQSAWLHAGGDERRATELLSDPSWVPRSPGKIQTQNENMGRVKELDEASKAQKIATKEKGKKSMIYANRTALESNPNRQTISTPPPPSKAMVELSVASPSTPAIAHPRRRRINAIVDSDSDADTDSDDDRPNKRNRQEDSDESRTLTYFNSSNSEALQELTGCTPEQAEAIVKLRPFGSVEDLNTKLGQGKKKAGPVGISPRLFEDCTKIFLGYGAVDTVLDGIEQIGASIRMDIASWTPSEYSNKGKGKEVGDPDLPLGEIEDGALSLRTHRASSSKTATGYLDKQPSLLNEAVQLKEYQLLGVNWLSLLYGRRLSCILADEMGLGKTVQVISFLAHLKENGNKGPHLVIVPSSTLENWCREFARFAPSISVQTYYAGKEERPHLRQTLLDSQRSTSKNNQGWEVLITTYNLAQGDDRDRKFFKRIEWDACIYDEGHVLKNCESQRYKALLKYGANWRLLLTGTPLQNNLQELVSLMNFILPKYFAERMDSLRAIFKVKGTSKVSLLSQERISRAKKMMTPFVLRRRKDQVLKDLPHKSERIEWCELTTLQRSIYVDALQRSRKTICTSRGSSAEPPEPPPKNGKKAKKPPRAGTKSKGQTYQENSANVLMDLRKAASHPMLFRTRFTDDTLTGITNQLLKEPDFKKRGALFDLVKEDMSVMTDAELQVFCATYKSTRKYLQDNTCYLDAGKVKSLLKLLNQYQKEDRKVLVFSQFTQILDILQAILREHKIKYLVLTGSTPVDVRQTLVDEFTEDESISVFLLSTKAGGMGINLTAASVVIMFDQDFNPHNDRQAQDRAYRIGQKRDVEVVKLISRGTIEEDMLKLGETKLALDEAVAGDGEEKEDSESAPEREMKMSLMNVLRQQLERQETAST